MSEPITDPLKLAKIARRAVVDDDEWESVPAEAIADWMDIAVAVRDAVCPEGHVVVPVPDDSNRVVHVIIAGGYCETVYADGTSDVEEMVDVEGDEDDGESDE